MSFEYLTDPRYLTDPEAGPAWRDLLPGRPEPYFLTRGEGERATLFADVFTVLLSGAETEGQFGVFTADAPAGQLVPAHRHHDTHEVFYVIEGAVRVHVEDAVGAQRSQLLEPGDFGYVPSGLVHAYQVERSARMLGVATGGFERFFQQMGAPTDRVGEDLPPFVPDSTRMQAAARAHRMEFLPGKRWEGA